MPFLAKVKSFVDERGPLRTFNSPGETNLGLVWRRIYFVENFDTTTIRGMHAHKKEVKEFYCAKGAILVVIESCDETKTEKFLLTPESGVLLVKPGEYMGWRALQTGSILVGLSNKREVAPGDDLRKPVKSLKFMVPSR